MNNLNEIKGGLAQAPQNESGVHSLDFILDIPLKETMSTIVSIHYRCYGSSCFYFLLR